MTRAALLLAAAGLAAFGCGGSPTSPSPAPLRLTVVQNPTFTADSLSFTLALENISQAAVDLTFPSSCDVLPYFADRNGRDVTPAAGGFACLTVITRRKLQPGETVLRAITVKGGTAPDGQLIVLPAGDYVVYARLLDSEFKLQSARVPFSLR